VKRFELLLNDKAYLVEVTKITKDGALVNVNGTHYEVGIKDLTAMEAPQVMRVTAPPPESAAAPSPEGQAQAQVETVGGVTTIKAPLPGLIIDVKVNVGDVVKVGDVLLVIETMKMENNVASPVAGTVKEISVSSGESVNEGAPMIVIAA
jgi:biotin carboxyl carrier protein